MKKKKAPVTVTLHSKIDRDHMRMLRAMAAVTKWELKPTLLACIEGMYVSVEKQMAEKLAAAKAAAPEVKDDTSSQEV